MKNLSFLESNEVYDVLEMSVTINGIIGDYFRSLSVAIPESLRGKYVAGIQALRFNFYGVGETRRVAGNAEIRLILDGQSFCFGESNWRVFRGVPLLVPSTGALLIDVNQAYTSNLIVGISSQYDLSIFFSDRPFNRTDAF